MREFFLNVSRYPRYLIAFTLGVMNSVAEPLARGSATEFITPRVKAIR